MSDYVDHREDRFFSTASFGSAILYVAICGWSVKLSWPAPAVALAIQEAGWLAFVGYLTGAGMFAMPIVHETLGISLPAWVLVVSITILMSRSRNADD